MIVTFEKQKQPFSAFFPFEIVFRENSLQVKLFQRKHWNVFSTSTHSKNNIEHLEVESVLFVSSLLPLFLALSQWVRKCFCSSFSLTLDGSKWPKQQFPTTDHLKWANFTSLVFRNVKIESIQLRPGTNDHIYHRCCVPAGRGKLMAAFFHFFHLVCSIGLLSGWP